LHAVQGDDVRVYLSIGIQTAVEQLLPEFEATTGHRLLATWGTGAVIGTRIAAGEPADLVVSTRAGIDDLVTRGVVEAATVVDLARSRIGIAIRQGAPKPDVSTVDALRRTLLAARTISYSDPAFGGVSGVHFARILEQLGIADEMRSRTRFPPPSGFSASLVASGEADLAVQQIPELIAPGVELAGPLPDEVQLVTTFTAALPAASSQREAAAAFVRFLRSPRAADVMKSKGLEPPAPNGW
jgi:molybdate transport system substrate-binding protein